MNELNTASSTLPSPFPAGGGADGRPIETKQDLMAPWPGYSGHCSQPPVPGATSSRVPTWTTELISPSLRFEPRPALPQLRDPSPVRFQSRRCEVTVDGTKLY